MRAMFSDWRRVWYPQLVITIGRLVQPTPAVPADVRIGLERILDYDGRSGLGGIGHPALVFGGTRDPYFTEPITRGTADGLGNGTLSLVRDAKHGAFHERKATFDVRATRFF